MNDLEFVGDYRQPQLNARQRELGFDGQSDGEFTFGDFLDIINPLQHIPVISSLYREITGDTISPHARVIGGTLFGGPSGLVTAVVNTIYSEVAGEDIGETVIAMFTGGGDTSDPQFAQAENPAPQAGAVPAAAGPETAFPAPLTTAAGPTSAIQPVPPAPGHGAPRRNDQPAPGPRALRQPLPETLPAADSGSSLLTGQAAMSALFNDLRGNRPSTPPASDRPEALALPRPDDGKAAKSFPLPPRRVRAAMAAPAAALPTPNAAPAPEPAASAAGAAHPLIFTQDMPEAAVADRMLQALDKYGQLTKQRQAEAASAAPRWQSDPVKGTAGGA